MSTPFLLGITGGIGSGKSVVCKILQTLNIPVYDADSRAKELMVEDNTLIEEIKAAFGEESYKNGQLNRNYLAQTVFHDADKLEKLNGLVHPAVGKDFEHWMHDHHNYPIIVKEAALLFESDSFKQLDKILLISSPEKMRIERVLKRDPHRTEEQVKAIIARQWSEEKKQALADYQIINDEKKLIIPQVLKLIKEISETLK